MVSQVPLLDLDEGYACFLCCAWKYAMEVIVPGLAKEMGINGSSA